MESRGSVGVVYTFYSYKGGVGRTMTMANVAALMAIEGHRVLVVDWDLEAPGLEVFFERSKTKLSSTRKRTPGIVDLLSAVQEGSERPWRECVINIQFDGGELDLIGAGQNTPDYKNRVQSLDWVKLFDDEHRLGNYLDKLRKEWIAPGAYDFVLIDSRTGITDIGDICTVLLPDALVLLFVSNWQNIRGIQDVIVRASEAHRELPVNRSRLVGVPVPSRDETYAEYDNTKMWKDIFAKELGSIYERWLPREVEPRQVLDKLFIPYYAKWSFGERLPVLEEPNEIYNPTSISAGYARLKNLLTNGLDWRVIESYELSHARSTAESNVQETRAAKKSNRIALAFVALVVLSLAVWFTMNRGKGDAIVDALRVINTTEERNSRERIEAVETLVLRDVDLTKTNLSDANLAGLRGASAKLPEARFINSSLVGADLSNAMLMHAQFTNSELNTANFNGADLTGAVFEGADLSGAAFTDAVLADVDFSGAKGLTAEQVTGACISEGTKWSLKVKVQYCETPQSQK